MMKVKKYFSLFLVFLCISNAFFDCVLFVTAQWGGGLAFAALSLVLAAINLFNYKTFDSYLKDY